MNALRLATIRCSLWLLGLTVPGLGRMLPSAALFERFNLSDVV